MEHAHHAGRGQGLDDVHKASIAGSEYLLLVGALDKAGRGVKGVGKIFDERAGACFRCFSGVSHLFLKSHQALKEVRFVVPLGRL